MENFFQNIKSFYDRLPTKQRIGIGLVVLGSILSLILITYWAQKTEYGLLFGNLPETAANDVVQILQTENINYELKDGGSSIYVPKDQVYDLRLRFAGEGIVSDGSSGYEIFDRNTLGMTDFMQKLNLKRALEGELARTISGIEQVEAARVHLVIPERSPFRETQAPATASVVVDLKGNSRVSLAHIEGMVSLVAGAVEGLEPNDVNILDANGSLLSDPNAGDNETQLTTNQLRLQTEKEAYLANKAQTLLDQMLGAGNSILRVNLELDFSRAVRENSTIDPESQTVIAEERLQEEGDIDNASSSVKNYEVSRSIETIEKSVGDISYLSVSVILNYKPAPDVEAEVVEANLEDASTSFIPHSDDELIRIEALVKEAVGWRPDRGDGFAISQLQFDTTQEDRLNAELQAQRRTDQIELYVRYGLMVIALGLAAWLIMSASKRAKESVEANKAKALEEIRAKERKSLGPGEVSAKGKEGLMLIDDFYTSKLSPEARAKLKAKQAMLEELQEQVLADPQRAANLLRSWLSVEETPEEVAEEPAA
ncbi:MAG: flagellar M-ring protein FliF [Rhodothermaceae bacterium]|nr:flagellar M-ring protein FliF [Rhodothermaceae bacterium]